MQRECNVEVCLGRSFALCLRAGGELIKMLRSNPAAHVRETRKDRAL
jgi:hypothetical protein